MPAHLRFAIIGGRGFGKTSLAAFLMSIAGNTNGTVIVDGPTQAILAIKNDELANGEQLSENGMTSRSSVSQSNLLKMNDGSFREIDSGLGCFRPE